MKNFLFLLVFSLSVCWDTQSQITQVTYQYTSPKEIEKAFLFYRGSKSVFFIKEEEEEENERVKITYNEDKSHIHHEVKSTDTTQLYQFVSGDTLYERRALGEDDYALIFEDFTILNWELIDSAQMIGNYACQLAKVSTYGRVFYAWYTPEIPSDRGPWKLGGLPGLILYAYDSEKRYVWKALSVKSDSDFDFLRYPTNERRMSLKEFLDEEIERVEKDFKYIEALLAAERANVSRIEFKIEQNYIEKIPER